MDQTSGYDKVLQFAADLLNAVRGFLSGQLNIDLPMWLAQGIVLALFLPLLVMAVRRAWKSRETAARITAWAVAIVTGAVSLIIVATWVQYWRAPLLEQLEGEVSGLKAGVAAEQLRVDLLDFRGESLGPRTHWLSGSNRFLLSYAPEFADPPRTVRVQGEGCKAERRPRRTELTRGAIMALTLECGSAAP